LSFKKVFSSLDHRLLGLLDQQEDYDISLYWQGFHLLSLGLNLSAILWRCFIQLSLNRTLQSFNGLQVTTVNCQRYSNWHLHSSSAYWCYLALICSSHFSYANSRSVDTLLYCTKNKLKKSASSMVLCLTKRLDSSINFNSLILVNLIKCFCNKAISIWLYFE